MMADGPVIRELTPELLVDYLSFFDRDAFTDNPEWASCYCYFYLADHRRMDWSQRTASDNRAAVSQLIRQSRMHGYLAYLQGSPVAWCHTAARVDLPNLQDIAELHITDVEQVGAIVCFLVARPYRRLGIARNLLEAACAGLQRQGMVFAEAYPRADTDSDAKNYHGPLQLYIEAGFKPFREFHDFMIVRKSLG
jgi:GNAT superfamily N-acetyltransferase